MKEKVSWCIIFVLLSNAFLLADEPIAQDEEQEISGGNSFIMYNGDFYRLYGSFNFSSGTSLKYNDLKKELLRIPENEVHIRQANTFDVSFWVLLGSGFGLMAASLGWMFYNYLNNGNTLTPIVFLMTPGIALVSGSLAFEQVATMRLLTAMNNYNITVMGLKLPLK